MTVAWNGIHDSVLKNLSFPIVCSMCKYLEGRLSIIHIYLSSPHRSSGTDGLSYCNTVDDIFCLNPEVKFIIIPEF